MVLAVVAVVVAGSPFIALVPLLGWPFALKKAMNRTAEKQREKFRETLPGYLQDLASAMRVGRSFVGAMTVVVDSAEEPTKSELGRVDHRRGLRPSRGRGAGRGGGADARPPISGRSR